ncbi:hypothetical protein HYX13_00710, partial [Candidatus Woesearchaeota archaeon]|nr:hypothetical protein [Candidatus Woesearchaeota archaeon]
MRGLQNFFAPLGLISILSLGMSPSACFLQRQNQSKYSLQHQSSLLQPKPPLKKYSREEITALEEKVNREVLQREPSPSENTPSENSSISIDRSNSLSTDPSIDLTFSLKASYDLPPDYSFNLLDGLHKKNSTLHWDPYKGEFYYGISKIPLKATIEPLQGLDVNYLDIITLDDIPLRSYVSISETELQRTWQESIARFGDELEQVYVPKYIDPFIATFDQYLDETLRKYPNDNGGVIPLEKYPLFISDLWKFVQDFYTTQVALEDQQKTQEAWNTFVETWENVFPFLDSSVLFENPQESVA